MSANNLEEFRLQTYTRAQADLAEKLKFMILRGDYVDVMNAIDEALKKGKEICYE